MWFVLASACTPAPDGVSSSSAEPSDSSSSFPEHDGVVEGVLLDADDQPLTLDVTLCGGICQVATPDAEGRFRFEGVWPQHNVFETLTYPDGDVYGWSRPFDVLKVTEGQQIELPRPVRVHRVETVRGLTGPQDLTLAPGLQVAFDADVIGVEHPLPYPATEVALGATELPEADWPSAVGDWTPLKAWGLAVWDLEATDAFAVTVTLDAPLPPGTEVGFLVADYVHGFRDGTLFEEPATLSPDGLVITSTEGLDRTTLWVAAAKEND